MKSLSQKIGLAALLSEACTPTVVPQEAEAPKHQPCTSEQDGFARKQRAALLVNLDAWELKEDLNQLKLACDNGQLHCNAYVTARIFEVVPELSVQCEAPFLGDKTAWTGVETAQPEFILSEDSKVLVFTAKAFPGAKGDVEKKVKGCAAQEAIYAAAYEQVVQPEHQKGMDWWLANHPIRQSCL